MKVIAESTQTVEQGKGMLVRLAAETVEKLAQIVTAESAYNGQQYSMDQVVSIALEDWHAETLDNIQYHKENGLTAEVISEALAVVSTVQSAKLVKNDAVNNEAELLADYSAPNFRIKFTKQSEEVALVSLSTLFNGSAGNVMQQFTLPTKHVQQVRSQYELISSKWE
ncbi:hypothetical protein [Vagococcus salmoninarum]|uniref:hypothetical protein n=1 Tax=Vagococcus salmoninarum TaxID=2739 RepID=UPI003F94865B